MIDHVNQVFSPDQTFQHFRALNDRALKIVTMLPTLKRQFLRRRILISFVIVALQKPGQVSTSEDVFYRCQSNSPPILHPSMICNNKTDCPDESDELFCKDKGFELKLTAVQSGNGKESGIFLSDAKTGGLVVTASAQTAQDGERERKFHLIFEKYQDGNEVQVRIRFSDYTNVTQKFGISPGQNWPATTILEKKKDGEYQLITFRDFKENLTSLISFSSSEREFTFSFQFRNGHVFQSIVDVSGPIRLDSTNTTEIIAECLTCPDVKIVSISPIEQTLENRITSASEKSLADLSRALTSASREGKAIANSCQSPERWFCSRSGPDAPPDHSIPAREICQNEVEARVCPQQETTFNPLEVNVRTQIRFKPLKVLLVVEIKQGCKGSIMIRMANVTEFRVDISFDKAKSKIIVTFDSNRAYETTLVISGPKSSVVGLVILRQGSLARIGFAHGQDSVILREISDFEWYTLSLEGFYSLLEMSFYRLDGGSDLGLFSFVPDNWKLFAEDHEVELISAGCGLSILLVITAVVIVACVMRKR